MTGKMYLFSKSELLIMLPLHKIYEGEIGSEREHKLIDFYTEVVLCMRPVELSAPVFMGGKRGGRCVSFSRESYVKVTLKTQF